MLMYRHAECPPTSSSLPLFLYNPNIIGAHKVQLSIANCTIVLHKPDMHTAAIYDRPPVTGNQNLFALTALSTNETHRLVKLSIAYLLQNYFAPPTDSSFYISIRQRHDSVSPLRGTLYSEGFRLTGCCTITTSLFDLLTSHHQTAV